MQSIPEPRAELSDVIGRLRVHARSLITGFSSDLPPYEQVPESLVVRDFVRGVRANIELFFDALETGEMPTDEALSEVVSLALTRIRDGVPLGEVLGQYRTGATLVWRELLDRVDPDERQAITDAAPIVMQYVATVTARIAVACADEATNPLWEQRERRRALAEALLAGNSVDAAGNELVSRLTDSYLVAVFHVAGDRRGASALVRLRTQAESIPDAFLRTDHDGWTLLVPMGDELPQEDRAIERLESQLAAIRGPAPEAKVWVGVAVAADRDTIPAAYERARTLASLSCRLGRTAGVCRLDDVLFEYAVDTSGPARDRLASLIDPLLDQPYFIETLETYVNNDFNQLATAKQLQVHRNTVTYRLNRIADLTGYDPLRARQAWVLASALIARQLAL